jgi:membrane-bound serine protease (ClpP class)
VILLLAILLVIFTPVATPWSIVIVLIACLLEVVEIVFLRRWARRLDRRTKRTTGAEAMIGEAAEVVEPCHPKGTVELMGELWAARCETGAESGETVRVEAVDGLTLVVGR